MVAKTNYLENKLADFLLRGQAYTPPATVYVALFTAAPNDAGGGSEVAGGGYARVAVGSTLANWSGTQGAGSTSASSGSGGTISNNVAIAFPSPSGAWGTVVAFGLFDAATGGNLLFYADLSAAKTINGGDGAPTFAPGSLTVQEDN